MSVAKPRLTGDAPILADGEARRIDWGRIYTVFLRALAVLAISRGLLQWAVICGTTSEGIGFEDLAPALQTTTVFFAVIGLVAGVGLWLTAAWGGVVWLLATVVALAIDAAAFADVPGWVQLAARPLPGTFGDLALVAFYLVAATAAARQADDALGD